jgi:hypothetical protein
MSSQGAVTWVLSAVCLLQASCLSLPGHPDDPQVPACLENAELGKPEESLYVLPFPVGNSYEVFQTYCEPVSHGKARRFSGKFS